MTNVFAYGRNALYCLLFGLCAIGFFAIPTMLPMQLAEYVMFIPPLVTLGILLRMRAYTADGDTLLKQLYKLERLIVDIVAWIGNPNYQVFTVFDQHDTQVASFSSESGLADWLKATRAKVRSRMNFTSARQIS